MQELSEREKKLLEIIKKLINLTTVWGVYEDRVKKMRVWAYETYEKMGVNTEWQNEILHFLEEEYGITYAKLDQETLQKVENTNGE